MVTEVDVISVGRRPGHYDVQVMGRPLLWLPKDLASVNALLPSVRITELEESFYCSGNFAGRGHHDVDVDYRFGRQSRNGCAAHVLQHPVRR